MWYKFNKENHFSIRFFSSCKCLQTLNLSGNNFDFETAKSIFGYLSKSSKIIHFRHLRLNLKDEYSTDKRLKYFQQILLQLSHLSRLELSNLPIHRFFFTNYLNNLEELYCKDCHLDTFRINFPENSKLKAKLKVLDLRNCSNCENFLTNFGEFYEYFIEKLHIKNINESDYELPFIIEQKFNLCRLYEMDLSDNYFEVSSLNNLLETVSKENNILRNLYLQNCRLNGDFLQKFGENVRLLCKLHVLDISCNSFEFKDFKTFLRYSIN